MATNKQIEAIIRKHVQGSDEDFELFMSKIAPGDFQRMFNWMLKNGMEFIWSDTND